MNSNETLSWDVPTAFYAESVLGKGAYVTRMHSNEMCSNRVSRDTNLVYRKVSDAPSVNLCQVCATEEIASSFSSSVVALRDISRMLGKLERTADVLSLVYDAKRRAESLTSMHPDFPGQLAAVSAEAERLFDLLPVHK